MVLQGIPMDTLALAKCPLAPIKQPSNIKRKKGSALYKIIRSVKFRSYDHKISLDQSFKKTGRKVG